MYTNSNPLTGDIYLAGMYAVDFPPKKHRLLNKLHSSLLSPSLCPAQLLSFYCISWTPCTAERGPIASPSPFSVFSAVSKRCDRNNGTTSWHRVAFQRMCFGEGINGIIVIIILANGVMVAHARCSAWACLLWLWREKAKLIVLFFKLNRMKSATVFDRMEWD